ncbi:AAA family ATPase [Streptomyces sp. MNU76]|nr:AAA family ATPase [Streptomyces sp. MNU76]MCC9705737.1 AAA family ATPase [Streptomyces sp. MNU76]
MQVVLDALERKGQVILHGPPGTGKTRLALGAALALDGRADALGADTGQRAAAQADMLHGDRVRLVTFHPSHGYEDFVEGFKPDLSATGPGLTLTLTDGLFHSLCNRAAAHPDQTFLLVVDEINRGDLPRIFGELITLLELDKRNLPVALPVSKRRFSVPPNVRVIGTMNTADRSISHLDAAVRRRFAFLPVGPDPDAVSGTVGPLDLAAFFESLNTRIARHLDADHQIGHANLLRDGERLDRLSTALTTSRPRSVTATAGDAVLRDRRLVGAAAEHSSSPAGHSNTRTHLHRPAIHASPLTTLTSFRHARIANGSPASRVTSGHARRSHQSAQGSVAMNDTRLRDLL